MAFGGKHIQTARLDHFTFGVGNFRLDLAANGVRIGIRVFGQCLQNPHFNIAAKLNIGAATGHICGNSHCAGLAGIGDYLRFLLVLACVQDIVRNALFFQKVGQKLGPFD